MTNSLVHTFNIFHAEKYGIEEAILIHHIQHWIFINMRMGKNKHEGRTWTYQTQKWILAHFPYFKNRKKIERLIDSLVKQEVLIKGNFNKSSYDHTIWYAFKCEKEFLKDIQFDPDLKEEEPQDKSDHSNGQNCPFDESKVANRCDESGHPIPDNKTHIYKKNKQNKETDASSSAGAEGSVSFLEGNRQHKVYYQNVKNELPLNKNAEILINTLKDSILNVKPDWKIPNLKKWLVDAEKLLRVDKRDIEEVKKVISWIILHDFWMNKYLKSTAFQKLAENFDSHQVAMKNRKYSEKDTPEYIIKQNEEVAKKIEMTYAKKVPTGIITVSNNYIEFVHGQTCEQIKFSDFTFQMQIEHNLRKLGLL